MPKNSEEFINQIMKNVVGVLCQNIGWHAAQTSSVDILADLMKRHFLHLAKASHNYAEHFGRSQVNMDDAALALRDIGLSVSELEEYVQNFDPVLLPYAKDVPEFPVPRESKLNFLRPGSEEVLSRPVHVHEYMPPMIFEEPKPKDDDLDQVQFKEEKMELEESSSTEEPKVVNGEVVVEEIQVTPPPPSVEMREKTPEKQIPDEMVNGITPVAKVKSESEKDETIQESSEDEIEALEKSSGSNVFTPFSGLATKSKSRDPYSENPALKRIRMMLREEGPPVREITSVMMTTSGFLTSSREGRLPECKRPANIEFFEPLPPPVVEKKKKVLTMKRIVEGIKKIDKEKENDSDKEGDEPALFGNPDKIFTSTNTAPPPSSANVDNEEKIEKKSSSEKEKDKDLKKLKKRKKLKLDKETLKKLTKGYDKDKSKLKIFKKSQNKALLDKSLKKSKKIKLKDMMIKSSPSKKLQMKVEGLDNIDSDEDFSRSEHPAPPVPSMVPPLIMKHKKKDRLPEAILKIKKSKDKSLSLSPVGIPPQRISPHMDKKISPLAPPRLIHTISPDGLPKKKRGRPRKNPLIGVPLPSAALAGLGRGLMEERPLKIKKSHMEPDMRSLIPDISIKTKAPRATPNFDLLRSLPPTPGLIPAGYMVPPAPVKLPPHIPPSISITPATPSTPTPMGKDSTSPFSGLPANVCSSVTITPINMTSSQKLPTPYDKTVTPGIGSPVMNQRSSKVSTSKEKSASAVARKSSPAPAVPIPTIKTDSSSGITITPIMMDKGGDRYDDGGSEPEIDQVAPLPQTSQIPTIKTEKGKSMLDKLDEDMSKEQRKKEKERRKELKKEKKKEKKEKMKEKDRDKDRDKDKSEKKEKRDKSEKKKEKKKEKQLASEQAPPPVPKLTLKITSGTPTPVDSPNPPQITIGGGGSDHLPSPPPLKKITIKVEEQRKRTPSPELARFSPLVTRPPKPARAAKSQAAAGIAADAMGSSLAQQIVSFPPVAAAGASGNTKRGRGRPGKSGEKQEKPEKPEKASKSKPAQQVGLVTETVGCIVDEQGNKIWICPKCGRQDDGSPMIGCDNCDDWYHFTCVGIVETPEEDKEWFCPRCSIKKKSKKDKKK